MREHLMRVFGLDEKRHLGLFDKPSPVQGKGDALLRVESCSICGTDVRTYKNGSDRISAPRVIGHETCGIVESSGDSGLNDGDRVLLVPAIGCGRCAACQSGYTNLCDSLETIGFQYDGGFAEKMIIPEKAISAGNVITLKTGDDPDDFVLVEPTACVVNGQEPLNIVEGNNVAIFGAGFIGCMHAELALLKGAASVTIFEPQESRRIQAAEMIPGIVSVNPMDLDLQKYSADETAGKGYDVVIVACSVGSVQSDSLKMAAKRGRVSLFGGIPGDATGFLDSNLIHYKELSVHGAHASTVKQNRQVVSWIRDGKLNVRKYISRFFPLDGIEQAFEALKVEDLLKAVIKPGVPS